MQGIPAELRHNDFLSGTNMPQREWLRLPVVSAGAEFLVMGHLMRRNILTYKAPPNNEGYDLMQSIPIRGIALMESKSRRHEFR